jgi:hypothetical protein
MGDFFEKIKVIIIIQKRQQPVWAGREAAGPTLRNSKTTIVPVGQPHGWSRRVLQLRKAQQRIPLKGSLRQTRHNPGAQALCCFEGSGFASLVDRSRRPTPSRSRRSQWAITPGVVCWGFWNLNR